MNVVVKIYRKIINTEPVIFLDIFKGAVLLGSATGFFVLDDAKAQSISVALGVVLVPLLTWLNRSEVTSNETVGRIVTSKGE